MQRYFVNEQDVKENYVMLNQEDSHHITTVMRMKLDEEILCINPGGQVALCKLVEISNDFVKASIVKWVDENNEMPVKITVAQGLPKGDKLELVVQKGTEMGASSFLPFFASRSIVKWDEKKGRKKVERLDKIAKEAAEQSRRNMIPHVSPPISFKQLLVKAKDYEHKIVAYEEEAKAGFNNNLALILEKAKRDESILAVFGPEGGLTHEEVDQLKSVGFQACALGPRILRTETAPLYVLGAVSYHTELLR